MLIRFYKKSLLLALSLVALTTVILIAFSYKTSSVQNGEFFKFFFQLFHLKLGLIKW